MNAEHMHIWGTKGEALLQLINFTYAVGGVVGPMIASPFLAEKEADNTTLLRQNMTFDTFTNQSESKNSTQLPKTDVQYAFLIGGIILIVTALPFFIVLLLSNKSVSENQEEEDQANPDRQLPLLLKILMIVLIFSYIFTYGCVELTFNTYLMSFVVDQYEEVTTHQGAYITTFFWVSFAGARFCSIFTSKYVTAVRLMYLHLSLLVCALTGFLVSALYSKIDSLTAFTCLVGVACSAIFPAAISWTEAELMIVTGPISAVILVGGAAGAMTNPFIVGILMEYKSNLWFCYFLMVALVLALSFFVILQTFNRIYVNKRYGTLRAARIGEKQMDLQAGRLETAL